MNTVAQSKEQTTTRSSGHGGSTFFAGIVSTGNNTQLAATLHSVLRQKLTDARLDICIFYEQENVPQSEAGQDVILIPYKSKEDFFSKFADAVERSAAQYCITLWSGEELFEGAFDAADKIFGKHEMVNWLTGIETYQARAGFNVASGTTAMRRWSYKIYERNLYKNSGRCIAPASTFWRKSIWATVAPQLYFVGQKDFCEDLWLAFFKTQKLYTCKAYFSSTGKHEKLNSRRFNPPNGFPAIEDSWIGRAKEFFFINNVPYLRLFYRNENELAPLIRFDYETQSYFLNEY